MLPVSVLPVTSCQIDFVEEKLDSLLCPTGHCQQSDALLNPMWSLLSSGVVLQNRCVSMSVVGGAEPSLQHNIRCACKTTAVEEDSSSGLCPSDRTLFWGCGLLPFSSEQEHRHRAVSQPVEETLATPKLTHFNCEHPNLQT